MSPPTQIKQRAVAPDSPMLPDDIPAWLQRILLARGITSVDEVNLELSKLHAPTMAGLPEAVAVLAKAIRDDQSILIVGDYDADGATSTALAVRALRAMGARRVDFRVPDRVLFGYGLSEQLAHDIIESHQSIPDASMPDVIVTVDNGISSVAGVALLKHHGIQVVVTDHHLPGDVVPDADAIVNPNQAGCGFPSKALAGVGVMFYCLIALRAHLRDAGWFEAQGIEQPNLTAWLDLVALGTVADVVPLDPVNRVLVAQGLKRIRQQACCPGIRALFQVAGRDIARAAADDLGFYVGPRLNAAGRLDDMSEGIRCLITDDPTEATDLAEHLHSMNHQRRNLQRSMQKQAEYAVQQLRLTDQQNRSHTLVLHHRDWHEGVVGLVSSQLKSLYHRPTVAFAPSASGEWKGSARSVDGLHIRDALALVDTRYPDLIIKFGGHAMAAGLSIHEHALAEFAAAFEEAVDIIMDGATLQPIIWTDGQLDSAELNLDNARLIERMGPWGQCFEKPVFEGVFELLDQKIVGERHLKVTLGMAGTNRVVEGIKFQHGPELLPDNAPLRCVYKMDVNHFRGVDRLQLLIEHMALAKEAKPSSRVDRARARV